TSSTCRLLSRLSATSTIYSLSLHDALPICAFVAIYKTMNKEIIKTEIQYKAVRSSGAGGQNVNKVATKVQLQFCIESSKGLTVEDRKSTRLNSSHVKISYAVFCLKQQEQEI